MKCKKLLSAALAGAMALSLAVPAFAADPDLAAEDGGELEIAGTLQTPPVKVTIPDGTTTAVVLNPYALTVDIPGGVSGTDTAEDQIINKTVYMKNLTQCNVQVSAVVTGVLPEGNKDVTFATAPVASTVKTKQVFMYFEMSTSDDGTTEPGWKAFSKTAAANQIVVAAAGKTAPAPKAMVVMAKSPDGSVVNTEGKGYAAFHLTGNCADQSTAAWTTDDAVSVNVAFTFLPTGADATAPLVAS